MQLPLVTSFDASLLIIGGRHRQFPFTGFFDVTKKFVVDSLRVEQLTWTFLVVNIALGIPPPTVTDIDRSRSQ